RSLTPVEEAAHTAKMEAMKHEREAEEAKRRSEAATKAVSIWKAAQPAADDHPYLLRKRIKAQGVRLHNGALVIPMRDGSELHSLQFIHPDGEKRFVTGGRVTGSYFALGKPIATGPLCIAEGFATGATIYEATGYPVAVAFNAGNLDAVARALRAKFPDVSIIVCADDDAGSEGNPGLTKATEAALAVGGKVVVPEFGADRPLGATDFNDLMILGGTGVVKAQISAAINVDNLDTSMTTTDKKKGESQADIMIKIVRESGAELFHTPTAETFISFPVEDHIETWPTN